MIEILFRGQNIRGQWHYGLLSHKKEIDSDYEWFISNSAGKPFAFGAIEKTIGQYTGLRDKNGDKVFEGDIVSLEYNQNSGHYMGTNINTTKHICEVKFNEETAAFEFWNKTPRNPGKQNFDSRGMSFYRFRNIEILGNIHENPELLNTK